MNKKDFGETRKNRTISFDLKIEKFYLININVEFSFHFGVRPVDKIVSPITLVIILN